MIFFSHFVWGRKFDLAVKKVTGHPRIIIRTNLIDLESPMLPTKIQRQSLLGSGEEGVKVFVYHKRAWWPSCSMVWNHLNNLPSILSTEGLM